MDITFTCTYCGQPIVVDEAGAGVAVQCPECGGTLTIPQTVTESRLKSDVPPIAPPTTSTAQPARLPQTIPGTSPQDLGRPQPAYLSWLLTGILAVIGAVTGLVGFIDATGSQTVFQEIEAMVIILIAVTLLCTAAIIATTGRR